MSLVCIYLIFEDLSLSESFPPSLLSKGINSQERWGEKQGHLGVKDLGWGCPRLPPQHPPSKDMGGSPRDILPQLLWLEATYNKQWPGWFRDRLKPVGQSSGSVCRWVCFQSWKCSEWLHHCMCTGCLFCWNTHGNSETRRVCLSHPPPCRGEGRGSSNQDALPVPSCSKGKEFSVLNLVGFYSFYPNLGYADMQRKKIISHQSKWKWYF